MPKSISSRGTSVELIDDHECSGPSAARQLALRWWFSYGWAMLRLRYLDTFAVSSFNPERAMDLTRTLAQRGNSFSIQGTPGEHRSGHSGPKFIPFHSLLDQLCLRILIHLPPSGIGELGTHFGSRWTKVHSTSHPCFTFPSYFHLCTNSHELEMGIENALQITVGKAHF